MAQDQNVEFLISAHVQGQQEIAKLINSVGALQKETERLKTANAGLTASTDAVIKNGVRYNNAIDAQSKALRNHRQGVQQLGMQFNDFATSVTTGASPLQAFSQQIGQVGYAMSMMGGVAGTVGSFLAGPWGALLLVGVSVAASFAGQLLNTGDAAQKAGKDFSSAADDARNLIGAMNALNLNKKRIELSKLTEQQQELENAISGTGKKPLRYAIASLVTPTLAIEAMKQDLWLIKSQKLEVENLVKVADRENAAIEEKAKAHDKAGRTIKKHTEAVIKHTDAVKEQIKINKIASEIISKSDVSFIERMNKLSEQPMAYAPSVENIHAAGEYDKIASQNDDIKKSFESIGMSVNDAFKGMLTAGMSWKDGMKSIIGSVIDELWKMYVVQQIVGFVSKTISSAIGGGIPKDITSGVNLADKMFATTQFGKSPGFANGTTGAPGGMAWVGERGPELVNLPRGSQVIPAHRASQMGNGGVTVNVDARGSSDPAAVRAQVQQGILEAAPAIIAAAEQRTVSNLRRPRLGGAMQ